MNNIISESEFNYLKEKIAHNMAHRTIQAKRFNRLAYKCMILKCATLHYGNTSYAEIAKTVNLSPERIRQILHKFYRRMRWCIEHDNQPL